MLCFPAMEDVEQKIDWKMEGQSSDWGKGLNSGLGKYPLVLRFWDAVKGCSH